ncbi:tryptophan 7-halogenase [Shewanella abyssi]|uniref:tryptophan halogenase family protein n=1 Tax=Shewanella abyssi TaxID=311789 RepID=UPI00200C45FC|nr:tryptophan halogenase family protein [Shewanella abyssi]MCL1052066.1 tryptophan 7-halogenase [Shewanella abyssi]
MNNDINRIIIIGGGASGWLTAGIIAAEHINTKLPAAERAIEVILIESPQVPTIGVGEGTWPSMRGTLKKMGISETEFIIECDASFKQGSRFSQWSHAPQQTISLEQPSCDSYYHPFSLPSQFNEINLAAHWQAHKQHVSFTNAVSFQGRLCDQGSAPKQIITAEYECNANYGYHLDAGKFAQFLQRHCTQKLGVQHIIDHVEHISSDDHGDIASVTTKVNGSVAGDLFIDCSGFKSLLLGEHYQVPFIEQKSVLFNDSALAVQVPYDNEHSPIASYTHSTAQSSGWIWDIGLQSRRGVGHVYSSAHISDDNAENELRSYLLKSMTKAQAESASLRKIAFNPGHRACFWTHNCVAVGIAAGFIEPLEASALALIEQSAKMISEQLPRNRQVMDIIAKRFNAKFQQRWRQIIDFLKLHYAISHRDDSDYWRDNRDNSSIPESLKEQLMLWQHQQPYSYDINQTEALFPAASFQYVLFGMGFNSAVPKYLSQGEQDQALALFQQNSQRSQQLLKVLPSNRALLDKVKQFGFPQI